MPEFDKWWNDLKKHRKRVSHWLPHWRELADQIGGGRPVRYFTLCARPMIDVFMLVEEGLLRVDPGNNAIGWVQFCECDQDQFGEIREMIAREDAGFFGRIEDVVLFEDDDFTAQFPTMESIDLKLEDEALGGDVQRVDRLLLKRTNFNVRSSFPYDFVNLDFCQYYYVRPPGMLRVNRTVEMFLDWQRGRSQDGAGVLVQDFVLAVTCRHDSDFPVEADARLSQLIRSNCAGSLRYREELSRSRGTDRVDEWVLNDKEDVFFSGWPKDIARSARDYGWSMRVLDYVYYRRVGDGGNPYVIACLVAKFSRSNAVPDYLPTALFALDRANRRLIPEIDRGSSEGRRLLASLRSIVEARNRQARRQHRPLLPDP